MKKGLVMEGGAMKGMFTCGVIDVFMENNIEFDGAIGVSAGAAFGCNYKSRQIGRPIRYNKRFAGDPRLAGIKNLITTGDIYGVEFCYHELPWKLDLWDQKAFEENPMEFYCAASDVETGKAVYHKFVKGDEAELEWIRASSSIPILSRIVEIDGQKLLDGGATDSIPLQFFEECGYEKNVVITTKPVFYRRKLNPAQALLEKAVFRKYPLFVKALMDYPERYNAQMEYLRQQEESGKALVIRPQGILKVKAVERDPEVLEHIYRLGRTEAMKRLDEVRAYLGE